MLKINYTEMGNTIEIITLELPELLSQALMLAKAFGQPINIYPEVGSILLSSQDNALMRLQEALFQETALLAEADKDTIEVVLEGILIASNLEGDNGSLIVSLNPQAENLIYQMWVLSQPLLLKA